MEDKKVIYVDIDETICHYDEPLKEHNYSLAKPDYDAIELMNSWYDEGHTIYYWTARGTVTGKNWRRLTEFQLDRWGVKYHELFFEKPAYDIIICDKAFRMEELL